MYSCICDLNVTFLTSESLTPHKVLQTNNNNNKSLTTFNIFLVSLLSSQGKNSHKNVFRINIFFTEYDCLDYEYLIFSYNNHYSHIPCGVWGCHWKTGENSMQWRLTGDTYVEFTESNSFCRLWVFQRVIQYLEWGVLQFALHLIYTHDIIVKHFPPHPETGWWSAITAFYQLWTQHQAWILTFSQIPIKYWSFNNLNLLFFFFFF